MRAGAKVKPRWAGARIGARSRLPAGPLGEQAHAVEMERSDGMSGPMQEKRGREGRWATCRPTRPGYARRRLGQFWGWAKKGRKRVFQIQILFYF